MRPKLLVKAALLSCYNREEKEIPTLGRVPSLQVSTQSESVSDSTGDWSSDSDDSEESEPDGDGGGRSQANGIHYLLKQKLHCVSPVRS